MLVEQVAWLCGQDDPVSGTPLPLEAVVLVDQLPYELARHCSLLSGYKGFVRVTEAL